MLLLSCSGGDTVKEERTLRKMGEHQKTESLDRRVMAGCHQDNGTDGAHQFQIQGESTRSFPERLGNLGRNGDGSEAQGRGVRPVCVV